jgi:hypothetical protein
MLIGEVVYKDEQLIDPRDFNPVADALSDLSELVQHTIQDTVEEI